MKNRYMYFMVGFMMFWCAMSLDADQNSTLSRVYGDYFIHGVEQVQTLANPGSLDLTFGLNGSLNCSMQLAGAQVRVLQALQNGSIIAALSAPGSNSFLAQYTSNGNINSAHFGTLGLVDLGTISSKVQSMFIDDQARIFVAGGNDTVSGTSGWLSRINSDGSGLVSFSGATWRFIGALGQQSTGNIIAVGFDNNYAQIARYTQGTYTNAGILDTTFGANGTVVLDGSNRLPLVSSGLYSVVIGADDLIYIAYVTKDNNVNVARFMFDGRLDTTFGLNGIVLVSSLKNANPAQLCMALDAYNNIVIAGQVGSGLQVASIVSAFGSINPLFNSSAIISSQGVLSLQNIITTNQNTILLIGGNASTGMNRVTRLTGTGLLDTTFNGTGYNEFMIGSQGQSSLMNAALGKDGKIYLAGFQTDRGVTCPYISSMYHDPFVLQVPQSPMTVLQGTLDKKFGSVSMYPGVVTPFDGLYGVALMQRARSITELASKNILVGMDGYLATSNSSNMMLTRLTPSGDLDTNFGSGSGKIALPLHQKNEYVSSIFEDKISNIYIAGYSDAGAILRQYSNQGIEQWVADINIPGSRSFDVIEQNSNRIILCSQLSSTAGMISAHLVKTGDLDTTFHALGTQPGKILTTDFGLNMGPIINGIINAENIIFVAYKNGSTGSVDVAAFYGDGSGLVSHFGTSGVVADLFTSKVITADNIRIAFDQNYNLIVAAASDGGLMVARCDGQTGLLDTTLNSTGILLIPSIGSFIAIKTVMGLSDGSIVVTANDHGIDDSMLLVRIAPSGQLDTNFNPQGVNPGVVSFKIGNRAQTYHARSITDACIQSTTGNILLTGYEELIAQDSTPMVMRVVGQSGTTEIKGFKGVELSPGMLDTTFSTNGSIPLDSQISLGAARVIYTYPSTDSNQGKMLVGVDSGSTVKIARMNAFSMALDQKFATKGIVTLSLTTGLQHISLDGRGNIVIAGSSNGQAWIKRLKSSGALDVVATIPSNIAMINHIYQQKSGRYIAACHDINGNGVIVAWQSRLVGSNTALLVDTTFNPLGDIPGQYMIGSTGLYSLAINNDDTILAPYVAGTVKVALLKAHGAGLVSSFGTAGILNSSITPKNPSEVRIAIDSNNKIIIAATAMSQKQSANDNKKNLQKSPPSGKPGSQNSNGSNQSPQNQNNQANGGGNGNGNGTEKPSLLPMPKPTSKPDQSNVILQVVRYLSMGQVDTTFNKNGSIQVISNIGTNGVTLAHCMTTDENFGQDKIILLGSNTAGGNGPLFAVRLAGDGSLDATWNPLAVKNDTPGVLTYAVDNAITMMHGSIAIDGAIYCAGLAENNVPLVMRIVGDSYITQAEQQPFEVAAGKLDTTIDTITPGLGALNLNLALGVVIGTPSKFYVYPDQSSLIASNLNGSTYVTKITAEGNLDLSFNGTGVVIIPDASSISDMYVANGVRDDGSIYLTGMNKGSVWAGKITKTGILIIFDIPNSTAMISVSAIRKTINGRILLAGQTHTSGIIVAYNNAGSALDTSFGVGLGYYATGMTTNLNTLELDAYDRIYIAYKDTTDGAVKVKRILSNGSGVDENFSSGIIAPTFALSSSQISLSMDRNNQQLVVAVQDGVGAGNIIKVVRYNLVTGSVTGAISNVTLPSYILKLSNICIDTLQNMYVIGSNVTNNYSYVARINSINSQTIGLDLTYGVGGIAQFSTGPLTQVAAGALHQDRRILLVGSDLSGIPYQARFFGDVYNNQVMNISDKAIPGTNDLSLDPVDGMIDGGISLSNLRNWSGLAGYVARAIQANNDGSMYIALSNGTNLIVGKVDADMNPMVEFGVRGLTIPQPMAIVSSLIVDSSGRVLVSGVQSGCQNIIRFAIDGTLDVALTGNLAATSATALGEQTCGRLIVSGQIGSLGAIYAYKNTGIGIDGSFGPASLQGYYSTGVNTQIDDFVIDNNDTIYFVYRNNANRACLGKLTANGAGLDRNFNNGSIIDTGIVACQTQPVRIAINNLGNILVGVSTSSFVQTCLYNGQSGAVISSVQNLLSAGCPVVTKIIGSGSDFVGSAYTSTNTMIVFKISGLTGCVDTGFGLLHNGIHSSDPNNALAIYGLSIQPDGKIVVAGTARLAPILMRVYGYPYVQQYQQMPGKIAAGNLDITLNPATQGILSIGGTNFAGYAIKRLYAYSNGNMLCVCDNGSSTIVVRLLKDFTLDTAGFNSPYGYTTLQGKGNVHGLYVNQHGTIHLAGKSNNGWLAVLKNSGMVADGWNNVSTQVMQNPLCVSQQSSNRILVAGFGSVTGTLHAYTPAGCLDTEFGMGTGILSTGIAAPIAAMSVNNLDQIFIVSVMNGTSVLQRVSADGGTITNLNTGTSITGITNNEIQLAQDAYGNIILAAATTNGFMVRRYTAAGANSVAVPIVIPAGVENSSRLSNLYTTSDGKMVLVGYESVRGNIIATRIDRNFIIDPSFNGACPVVINTGGMNVAYDASVDIDNRIMIACSNNNNLTPSCIRIYGDDYISKIEQSPVFGLAGTVDGTFGLSGALTLSSLGNGLLNLTQAKAVLPLANGGNYIALNNGVISSKLIYTTAENSLNSSFGIAGIAADTLNGVNYMMQTGAGNVLLAGTTAAGTGWISRYNNDNSGQLDKTFNGTGTVTFGQNSTVNVIAEQTLARIVIAGKDAFGQGIVRALTCSGAIDTTFNANISPGVYNTEITTEIFAMVVDQFDRIIIAYQNESSVDLIRLHAHGVIDQSFGIAGIISGAILQVDQVEQVALTINAAGNIVLAAHTLNQGISAIAVKSYDNLSAASGNGSLVNGQSLLTGLINPVLKKMVATQDGKVLILGNQSSTNPSWIARCACSDYAPVKLDTSYNERGIIPGMMMYAGSGVTNHSYYAAAVRADGRIVIVGNEDLNPVAVRFYNNPYILQGMQSPNARPVGTHDRTLGWANNDGITFVATPSSTAAQQQKAQAIGLQDDNNILIALDGTIPGSKDNYMFLNMFDVSGLPNQTFGTAGKLTLPHNFTSEHVEDMYNFSTIAGINKAILVGYATNPVLKATGSLMMQYNTSLQSVDSSFGGLNGNPTGVVFGDALQYHAISRQSMGRLIVAGTGLDGNDILLGYTPSGLLDSSFGIGGCLTRGTNPLYVHVIDAQNRILIAYNDGKNNVAVARVLANGSGLDTSFGLNGIAEFKIAGIVGNSNMRIALDGQGNIIVAAVTNAGSSCTILRYLSNGVLDASLIVSSDQLGGMSNFILSKLLVDVHGKILIIGSDADAQKVIIARTLPNLLSLDQTFNQLQNPGYITYTVGLGSHQAVTDALIHPDGRIVVVGCQN